VNGILALILAVPLAQAPLGDGWFPVAEVEVLGASATPGLTRVRTVERFRGDWLNGEWLAAWPDRRPRAGERLILFYARSRDSARVLLPLHTYEATEENRRYLRQHLVAGPRTRLVQFPLLIWAIVGGPLTGLCAVFFRWRVLGVAGFLSALTAALVYETGVPRLTNIRVDWLLLGPALLVTAALAGIAWFRRPPASKPGPR
jgi:hypothetical protein